MCGSTKHQEGHGAGNYQTCTPGGSLTIQKMALSMGFRSSVSLLPAIQAKRPLAVAPEGLTPSERVSLRWTHKLGGGVHTGCFRRSPVVLPRDHVAGMVRSWAVPSGRRLARRKGLRPAIPYRVGRDTTLTACPDRHLLSRVRAKVMTRPLVPTGLSQGAVERQGNDPDRSACRWCRLRT